MRGNYKASQESYFKFIGYICNLSYLILIK